MAGLKVCSSNFCRLLGMGSRYWRAKPAIKQVDGWAYGSGSLHGWYAEKAASCKQADKPRRSQGDSCYADSCCRNMHKNTASQ
jgi:hypothetical protein